MNWDDAEKLRAALADLRQSDGWQHYLGPEIERRIARHGQIRLGGCERDHGWSWFAAKLRSKLIGY